MMDLDKGSETSASSGVRVEARSSGKQARARGERGQSMVEFAVALPVFLIIVFGFIWFSLALFNYVVLTSATNASAQSLSTFQDVTVSDPCAAIGQAFYSVAPGLAPTDLYFTINIATSATTAEPPVYTYTNVISNAQGGTGLPSCSTNTTTQTPGYPSQLVVTYNCQLSSFGLNIPCLLKAQSQYISQ